MAERQPEPRVLLRDPAGDDGGGGQAALHADAERGGSRTRQPVGREGHRVHEDRRAQPLGLGEEAEETRVAQGCPADARGDLHAGQARLGDVRQLVGGEIGVLQRHRAQAVDPAGRRRAQAGQVLVDPAGQVAPGRGRQPVVQQRGERRGDLGVDPAGRGGGQPPLRVEPGLPRGEAHRSRPQQPGAVGPGRLHPRPLVRVAPGHGPGKPGERAGDHMGVRVDQHHDHLPGTMATCTASSPGTSPASVSMARAMSSRPNVCVCIRSSGNRPVSMSRIASA